MTVQASQNRECVGSLVVQERLRRPFPSVDRAKGHQCLKRQAPYRDLHSHLSVDQAECLTVRRVGTWVLVEW
jgi:hypothetical protein